MIVFRPNLALISMTGRHINIPVLLLRRSSRLRDSTEREEPTTKFSQQKFKKVKTDSKSSTKDDNFKNGFEGNTNQVQIKREDGFIPPINSCDKKTAEFRDLLKPDGYINIDAKELDLERTLLGGQSFRWSKEDILVKETPLSLFTGVILNHALQLWRISQERIAFKILDKGSDLATTIPLLEDYFQVKHNLKDLYKYWSGRDPHLAECCEQYYGFRILRQDPVENVFSFICATNNNIKRISQMVEKLCRRYGSQILMKSNSYGSYMSFPSIERLAESDVFDCLRHELGFGYRAKFITGTAEMLVQMAKSNNETPQEYLTNLRLLTYRETRANLVRFPGIGRKVADCICLMSMDHLNSVPIDCHIYEIVCRHYLKDLRKEHKTLTDSVHDMIGDYFNDLHGDLAGWATSVLFIAELKHLKLGSLMEKEKMNKEKNDGKKSKKTKNRKQDHP